MVTSSKISYKDDNCSVDPVLLSKLCKRTPERLSKISSKSRLVRFAAMPEVHDISVHEQQADAPCSPRYHPERFEVSYDAAIDRTHGTIAESEKDKQLRRARHDDSSMMDDCHQIPSQNIKERLSHGYQEIPSPHDIVRSTGQQRIPNEGLSLPMDGKIVTQQKNLPVRPTCTSANPQGEDTPNSKRNFEISSSERISKNNKYVSDKESDPHKLQFSARSVSIIVNQADGGAIHQSRRQADSQEQDAIKAQRFMKSDTTLENKIGLMGSMQCHTDDGGPPLHCHMQTACKGDLWCSDERDQKSHQIRRLLHRSLLSRIFKSWNLLAYERWWKMQLKIRDDTLGVLALRARNLKYRPVRYMQRYHMRILFRSWRSHSNRKRIWSALILRMRKQAAEMICRKAFINWRDAARTHRVRTMLLNHVDRKRELDLCRASLRRWLDHLIWKQMQRKKLLICRQKADRYILTCCLRYWSYLARIRWRHKSLQARLHRRLMHEVFDTWLWHIRISQDQEAYARRIHDRRIFARLNCSFYIWRAFVDGCHARRNQEALLRLNLKVETLQTENERLSRVIDSGDWEKGLCREFFEAGKVLQQERDALLEIVEKLSGTKPTIKRGRQHGTLATQRTLVEHPKPDVERSDIRLKTSHRENTKTSLFNHPTKPISWASERPRQYPRIGRESQPDKHESPFGDSQTTSQDLSKSLEGSKFNAHSRNKMLVRAGSSFNALVRALKQDLLASGALKRDPHVVYEVDKLSLNHVEALPDGVVRVRSANSPASFTSKSLSENRGRHHGSETSSNDDPHAAQANFIGGRSVAVGKRLL